MARRMVLAAIGIVMTLGISAVPEASVADDATPGSSGATLMGIRWQLATMTVTDGTARQPPDPARHTVQFFPDGRVAIQADCNAGLGYYTLADGMLTIERLATSLVGCPSGTFGSDFAGALTAASSYTISVGDDANDHLTIATSDGATLDFAPAIAGVVWQFERFRAGNGKETAADDPSRYTLEVLDDGTARVRADCNRGQGTATIIGSAIKLTVALTRATCPPGSLSMVYAGYVDEAVSWVIRDGQLHLSLPMDAGIASFAPVVWAEGTPPAAPVARG